MSEFPGRPQYSEVELAELKKAFEENPQPTSEELENFVIIPEKWQAALAQYRMGGII